MPIYQYACPSCKDEAELTRGFNDEEVLPHCQLCRADMKRVYGTFGIHFNGPGFYSTGG